MNVSCNFQEVVAILDQKRLVAPLPKVAEPVMPSIVVLGVWTEQPMHTPIHFSEGGFGQKVNVSQHQAEAVDNKHAGGHQFVQKRKELPAIGVIRKDLHASDSSGHCMISRPGKLDTQRSCHLVPPLTHARLEVL